ncbi:hypothetical protein CWB96_13425 [Pseudoalteromonas citrea]|uniref:DUF5723 domain-containing protein n=1 Tax=Pseudoalteromonas citrea TaxID=43655 RepID=A0A5S3XMW5_9GAMM|nr:hypothetical protein [Pseudoalteromonas citrea]TMP46594.1 hypothetical protein CWB97_01655 [Pseudoalteromonas citrea]TMP57615.1 hypothetical protein CWB96_13425 [Pseudoalteromonas citrea]
MSKYIIFPYVGLFLPLFSNASTLSTNFFSHSHSNIAPIKQIIDDDWLEPPSPDADIGFSQSLLEVKLDYNGYSLSSLNRLDYFLTANYDTALAYYQNSRDIPLNSHKPYSISLNFHEQKSRGIAFGYAIDRQAWQASFQLSYWDVVKFRNSNLNGSITGNNTNEILGELTLDENYTHKNFLKRPNERSWNTSGYGYSANIAFEYIASDTFTLSLKASDLFNRFKYKMIGNTQAEINTKGSFVDNEGFSSFRPLLSGIESERSFSKALPISLNFGAKYTASNIDYLFDFYRRANTSFYLVGAQYRAKHATIGIKYDIQNQVPELSLSTEWLNLLIALDTLDFKSAYNIKLGLNLNLHF